jgi:branched-subunit amino acid transport protein
VTDLLLILACGAATYAWRGLGVMLSGRVRTDAAVFVWVGCVAWAMIGGLTARILIMPTGILAATTFADRLVGAGVALAVFFALTRRNLLAGVLAGFATMIVLTLVQRG